MSEKMPIGDRAARCYSGGWVTMQYDAFISYRHADGEAARGVAKLLRAFNLKVVIDDGIAAGAEWAPEIWAALELSKTLMVLWSRSAAQSSFVREEWMRAPATCNVFALALDGQALAESRDRRTYARRSGT